MFKTIIEALKPRLVELILLALVVISLFIWFKSYGSKQYLKGFNEAKANYLTEINKLNQEAREKELSLVSKLEDEQVKNEAFKKEANKAITTANADVARLQSRIKQIQRDKLNQSTAKTSNNTNGIKGRDTQCWYVLEEAIGRYSEVAKDADGLVEKLRTAKSYINTVNSLNLDKK